jgi:hypothetical protein
MTRVAPGRLVAPPGLSPGKPTTRTKKQRGALPQATEASARARRLGALAIYKQVLPVIRRLRARGLPYGGIPAKVNEQGHRTRSGALVRRAGMGRVAPRRGRGCRLAMTRPLGHARGRHRRRLPPTPPGSGPRRRSLAGANREGQDGGAAGGLSHLEPADVTSRTTPGFSAFVGSSGRATFPGRTARATTASTTSWRAELAIRFGVILRKVWAAAGPGPVRRRSRS